MKGLSPLIATVILIVIVVSIAAIITTFATNITRESQDRIENRTQKSVDCSGGEIRIRDVYLQPGNYSRVIVENVGLVGGLSIGSAQVINATGYNISATNLPINNFDIGDIETVIFANLSGVNSCSNFSQVVISTSCPSVNARFKGTPTCV